MNIIKRAKAPTPKFFKKVRNIGLILVSISGTLLASPVTLPLVITKIAGYLALAGSVASAVSQVTVKEDQNETTNKYQTPF
jgi:hypothetical protein